MKMICVFAHFDKDSIIDDYVVYYIQELKKIVDSVIFVSANTLDEIQINKIKDKVDCCISEKHNEYDWGSFKRGFFHLYNTNQLNDCYCLIFVNDSCAGPLYSLKSIVDEMNRRNCDFWGLTKNNYGFNGYEPHVQSYFLGLKDKVFLSSAFNNFISSIKHLDNKKDIVTAYEVGFTKKMVNAGFTFDVYIKVYEKYTNVVSKKWRELITNNHFPLIKLRVPRLTYTDITTSVGWQDVIRRTEYPVELIEKNINRTKSNEYRETNIPLPIKNFIYGVANFIPKIGIIMKKFSSCKIK